MPRYGKVENEVHASAKIGEDTMIWWFARVLQNVVIGKCCSIGGGTEIGRGSTIGDYSRVGANCFLPSNSQIGQYVFIGPGVVCTDDRYPRVPAPGDPAYDARPPVIENGASVGAGAVILPGIKIGAGARVAAGSVVTHDVPAGAVVKGSPARIHALSAEGQRAGFGSATPLVEDAGVQV